MEKLRKNKGITLIALVITIIVLLILAGVTIATLTGDNGILNQADKAKTETTKASAKEQVEVEVLGSYGADGNLDNGLLRTNLNNIKGIQGVPDQITDDDYTLTVTVDGVKIDIKKDGTVEYVFDAEEWDKTACKESSFLWESDEPTSGEAYHTIVGYADSITNETKLKIPSRCHEIRCDGIVDVSQGRDFAKSLQCTLELPNTITKIGDSAFLSFNLTNIKIPSSVISIGANAFAYCEKLTSITIPNSVTVIESGAFYDCISLSDINIPNTITRVGSAAFHNTEWYNQQPDGLIYIGKVAYGYKGTMSTNTSIDLKEDVKIIADSAFRDCDNLTSITIPNSVISIGESAFYDCNNLTSIIIPNSVTEIGNYAFMFCEGLTNIMIPSSVKSIGNRAFYDCISLTNITIPVSVTSLGSDVFASWTSSQIINIQGHTSAPSGWDSNWQWRCSATINWNQ